MKKIPIVLIAAALTACSDSSSRSGVAPEFAATVPTSATSLGPPDTSRPDLGGPLPGLTPSELAAFVRGREVFERRFKPSEGLGPLYNGSSCSSCHSTPVTGGSSEKYRNFYIAVKEFPVTQIQVPLTGLPSVIVPSFGSGPHFGATFSLEGKRTEIPATLDGSPVISAQRNAVPIFGTGLFEFISDATILANSDPDDTVVPDGISGRFNVDLGASKTAVGRFGVKLQANAVEFFTRGPLQNQMGITSDPFLGSGGIVSLCSVLRAQGGAMADNPTQDSDGVPDPEISTNDLGDLIAYTRFLAPPEPLPFNEAATAGEVLFTTLGCVKCHIPELPSSRGPVRAYTDLLLHEVGSGLADGIHFGSPQSSTISSSMTVDEFRTQPLWGVSLHAPFLHDGRAETLQEAIEMHGGEAAPMRDAFNALTPSGKSAVVAFLRHL